MMTVDTSKFRNAMKELKRDVPVEMRNIGNWQMGLAVRTIITNIGVKLDSDEGLGGRLPTQKRAQERTIDVQLRKLFTYPDKGKGWTLSRQDRKTGDVVATRGSSAYFIDQDHFLRQGADLSGIHKKHRGKFGQVYGNFAPVTRGNKTYDMAYTSTRAQVNRYVKLMQSHIGRTKATFLKALESFNAKSGGYSRWTAPSWITRHRSWASSFGKAEERWNDATGTGEWMAGSDVPWAGDLNASGKVKFAMKLRMIDLQSGHALMRLKGMIERKSAA